MQIIHSSMKQRQLIISKYLIISLFEIPTIKLIHLFCISPTKLIDKNMFFVYILLQSGFRALRNSVFMNAKRGCESTFIFTLPLYLIPGFIYWFVHVYTLLSETFNIRKITSRMAPHIRIFGCAFSGIPSLIELGSLFEELTSSQILIGWKLTMLMLIQCTGSFNSKTSTLLHLSKLPFFI